MAFTHITPEAYQALIHNTEVLKTRRGKPVILRTANDTIIKHIYHRTGWSSSRIWPYASRFARNSKKLLALGFAYSTILLRIGLFGAKAP